MFRFDRADCCAAGDSGVDRSSVGGGAGVGRSSVGGGGGGSVGGGTVGGGGGGSVGGGGGCVGGDGGFVAFGGGGGAGVSVGGAGVGVRVGTIPLVGVRVGDGEGVMVDSSSPGMGLMAGTSPPRVGLSEMVGVAEGATTVLSVQNSVTSGSSPGVIEISRHVGSVSVSVSS